MLRETSTPRLAAKAADPARRQDGHSDFAALRTTRGGAEAAFVAFDLLSIDGEDWRKLPLEVRRAELGALVAGSTRLRLARRSTPMARSSSPRHVSSALRGSFQSASAGRIGAAG
ncbi:hypothetical protein [Rhodoblastus sp.]|uniref:hypothetical protein n=1 Tax=Rhodoblastus sp. TaxID=1962975 RepID=UPI003F955985